MSEGAEGNHRVTETQRRTEKESRSIFSVRVCGSAFLRFLPAPSVVFAPLCALLFAVACGGRAEQVILRGYFDTCAAADDVMLSNTALVALDPARDGVVGRFRVLGIDPPVRQPAAAHPRVSRLSLADPGRRHDEAAAVLVSEDIQVRAEIHQGGRVSERPMVITLARAHTPETVGRWIVVRLVLDGRTLPEASSGRR